MTESPKSKLGWLAGLLVRLAIIFVLGCFVAWRLAAIWIIKLGFSPGILIALTTIGLIAAYTWAIYFGFPFAQSGAKRRRLLISAVIGLPAVLMTCAILVISVLIVFFERSEGGQWPFPPLPPPSHIYSHKEVGMANGGLITIEGYERRSWRGNNVDYYASYRPPGQTNDEVFGTWSSGGADIPALVFFVGKLVVVQNPDRWALHVRNPEGRWKSIEMRFPRLSDTRLSFFTNATSLSESDLLRIRNDGGTNHPDWDPSAWIDRFDPDTRILSVNYMFWKDLTFKLSEDGNTLHLISIRVRKSQ